MHNKQSQSSAHWWSKFAPIFGTLLKSFPNGTGPFKNFFGTLHFVAFHFLDHVPPNILNGVHVGTLWWPWHSNFRVLLKPWLNDAEWDGTDGIGELSWIKFTLPSGNLCLMDGKRTFCKISKYFSLLKRPLIRTKSPPPSAEMTLIYISILRLFTINYFVLRSPRQQVQ